MEKEQPSTARSSKDFSARTRARKPMRQRWVAEVARADSSQDRPHQRKPVAGLFIPLATEGHLEPVLQEPRWGELELPEKYRATSPRG